MSAHRMLGPNHDLASIAEPRPAAHAASLRPLVDAIREIHGDAVRGVVYYGSCLRRADPYGGLVDLYVIVDRYRRAQGPVAALWNGLLPPSVYYLERRAAAGTLRAKYAVLSMRHLRRGASRWFQVGVWGRFAQPVAFLYVRDGEAEAGIREALGAAVVTLLKRALPALPARLTPEEAFAGALDLCYACELRVERGGRGAAMVASGSRLFRERFCAALPWLGYDVERLAAGAFRFRISAAQRRRARVLWRVRRLHGKLLNLLRLVKATFTFRGAIDYAAWKVSRHTGVAVEPTARQRRHPLIFAWGLLWRLYRGRTLR